MIESNINMMVLFWNNLLTYRDAKLTLWEWDRLFPVAKALPFHPKYIPVYGETASSVCWVDNCRLKIEGPHDGCYSTVPEKQSLDANVFNDLSVDDVQLHSLDWRHIASVVSSHYAFGGSPHRRSDNLWYLGKFEPLTENRTYLFSTMKPGESVGVDLKAYTKNDKCCVLYPVNDPEVLGEFVSHNIEPVIISNCLFNLEMEHQFPIDIDFNGSAFSVYECYCFPSFNFEWITDSADLNERDASDYEFNHLCDFLLKGEQKTLRYELLLEHPRICIPSNIVCANTDHRNSSGYVCFGDDRTLSSFYVYELITNEAAQERIRLFQRLKSVKPLSITEKNSNGTGTSSIKYELTQHAGHWLLIYDSDEVVIKHMDGLYYISYLINNPNESIHALNLSATALPPCKKQDCVDLFRLSFEDVEGLSTYERSDSKDLKDELAPVWKVIKNLRVIIENETTGEYERKEAERELQSIMDAISKIRSATSNASKAYDAIKKAIDRLCKFLKSEEIPPDHQPTTRNFCAHIEKCLKSGKWVSGEAQHFVYKAIPDIVWE